VEYRSTSDSPDCRNRCSQLAPGRKPTFSSVKPHITPEGSSRARDLSERILGVIFNVVPKVLPASFLLVPVMLSVVIPLSELGPEFSQFHNIGEYR
jgi:hypothetical protein